MRRAIGILIAFLALAIPARASISFVQAVSNTATTGTSITVTITTTAGHQLVMCSFETTSIHVTGITSANTWTIIASQVQGTGETECWNAPISSTAETSVQVNFSGTIVDGLAVVGEYSGGLSWGNHNVANSASATTLTVSVTTQDNNNFIIGGIGVPTGSTITDSVGTRRSKPSAGSTQLWFGDNTSATPASTSLTVTTAATHPYSAVVVELRTSAGSGPIGSVLGGPSTVAGPSVRE